MTPLKPAVFAPLVRGAADARSQIHLLRNRTFFFSIFGSCGTSLLDAHNILKRFYVSYGCTYHLEKLQRVFALHGEVGSTDC